MIELININKSFDKPLFSNFNLKIKEQQITCILGESGVGKTTILKMLGGMVDYQGQINNCPKKIAYIFQEDRLIPNLTVEQNIKLINPLVEDKDIVNIFNLLEISGLEKRYPKNLSGGEAKRVSLARAFLYDGDIILMDEAFSSLDLSLKIRLLQYFEKYWLENKKTILFVTHDVDEALMLAHHIYILKSGKITFDIDVNVDFPRKHGDNLELRNKIINNLLSD